MDSRTSATEEQQIPVTAIISRRMKAGREQAFEEWLQGISQAAARFPGHQGVSILRPRDPANPEYVIILKFDSVPHLREWLQSDTRREWIGRSDKLTETPDKVTELTGLEAWFTLPGQPMPAPPLRWKMFLLTVAAAYPLIMVVTALFGPWLGQSPWLFNFVVTVALTTLLTYFAMPLVTRIFYAWLYPLDPR
jgi:antibiotic biosynthesis monooxygenase (ABM) superfamily enzyme